MGAEIVGHFQIEGTVVKVEPLGNGLINDTYKVTTAEADKPDYVLQRINHAIFQDVDLLQHNIEVVTAHIRQKLEESGTTDIDRKVLRFIPTASGKTYYFDGTSYWRVMVFIPPTLTMPARPSDTSKPCCPICQSSWARPSPIFTTWNSASSSCMRLCRPIQPDV